MRKSLKLPFVIVIGLTLLWGDVSCDEPRPTIARDPAIQAKIDSIVDSLTKNRGSEAGEALSVLVKDNFEKVLRQLILRLRDAQHEEDDMACYFLIIRLIEDRESFLVHTDESKFFYSTVDLLESNDRKLKETVTLLLQKIVEQGTPDREPNFEYYEAWLGGKTENPPLGLIKYMFERKPGQALNALTRAFMKDSEASKDFVLADHVMQDVLWKQRFGFLKPKEIEPEAVKQLDKLSQHEAWWARLYVAEILHQHPEFQTKEMVERLKDDKHPLVREAISLKKKKVEITPEKK